MIKKNSVLIFSLFLSLNVFSAEGVAGAAKDYLSTEEVQADHACYRKCKPIKRNGRSRTDKHKCNQCLTKVANESSRNIASEPKGLPGNK